MISVPLEALALINYRHRQPRKYLEQDNILCLLNIYFIIGIFDIDTELAQYTISK